MQEAGATQDYYKAITKGAVFRYALLPGIIPRLRSLSAGSGWLLSSFAALVAIVYGMVRLLPPGHPYLDPANSGSFGLRQVIVAASENLRFEWKNIDKILVFFSVITGIVLLFMQGILLILSFLVLPAWASMPTSAFDFFTTDAPLQDIAFILLDRVFGVPDPGGVGGFFKSCYSLGVSCTDSQGRNMTIAVGGFPTPLHLALHAMLQFYDFGIFLVGFIVILYFVITVTAETAQSGTPFGRRFNHVWAPVRLIFFFFLIVPIVYGLNIAQMAVLHTAYFGSSMATNGWLLFNKRLSNAQTSLLGELDPAELFVIPQAPEPGSLLQFYTTVTTCKYAERILHNRYIQAYLVRNPTPDVSGPNALMAYKWPTDDDVSGPVPSGATETSFEDALKFYNDGNIVVRFGEYNPELYPNRAGNVYPWCGEIVLTNPGVSTAGPNEVGTEYIFQFWYYALLRLMWADNDLHNYGARIARTVMNNEKDLYLPTTKEKLALIADYKQQMETAIKLAVEAQANAASPTGYVVPQAVLEKGWAGAGIWYNRLAKMNNGIVDAVFDVPRPKTWPDTMEQILKEKRKASGDVASNTRFDPNLPNNETTKYNKSQESSIARAEGWAFNLWERDETSAAAIPSGYQGLMDVSVGGVPSTPSTGNAFIDMVNAIFGTSGLFNMRKNNDVHPLAQLVGIGRSLIDSAIVNLGFAAGAGIVGSIGSLAKLWTGSLAKQFSGFAMSIALTGITIGFLLCYVVPFLPFVYFFFAVGGWIKAVFEAMIGVPLWALAHLRINGDGLPGKIGMGGYFLIFEIFVRPILTVFGLIGAITIMAAMVRVLNDIYDLAVSNLTGHDPTGMGGNTIDMTSLEFYRNTVDEFFFTIMYAIVVYMMAMSCFKLIDLVPNQILRWLGGNISTFGEHLGDPGAMLSGMVSRGSMGALATLQENDGMFLAIMNTGGTTVSK